MAHLLQTFLFPEPGALRLALRDIAANVVTEGDLGCQYAAAVISFPLEIRVTDHVITDPPPENRGVHPEGTIDLRHVSRLSEGIRHISHIHHRAKFAASPNTIHKIPDNALG